MWQIGEFERNFITMHTSSGTAENIIGVFIKGENKDSKHQVSKFKRLISFFAWGAYQMHG